MRAGRHWHGEFAWLRDRSIGTPPEDDERALLTRNYEVVAFLKISDRIHVAAEIDAMKSVAMK